MTTTTLTPDQLRAWRRERRLSQPALARRLGLSVTTLQAYERGQSRDQPPRPRPIPLAVELALAALSLGITSYSGGGVTLDPGAAAPDRKRRNGANFT